jgi:hypothetical protein
MITYKDTTVKLASGSALGQALFNGRPDEAAKIYKETTERFFALYGKGDAGWFINKHKENV